MEANGSPLTNKYSEGRDSGSFGGYLDPDPRFLFTNETPHLGSLIYKKVSLDTVTTEETNLLTKLRTFAVIVRWRPSN
jgi:hypothetical protein